MNRQLAILSLLIVAPAACNVGPDYHRPPLSIESTYGLESAKTDAATRWWENLRDPALNALLEQATSNNLDLKQAEARIREARAQRNEVYGGEFPTLNADGQYQHQRFSQNAAPFNAFNVPHFPWEFNLYELGFDSSWEIDVFGGTRRAVEAAGADVEASQEDRRGVLVTLLAETARTYVELRGAQQQRLIARQNLDVQNETLSLTRDRMNKGIGSELDVSRAAAQVAQTAGQVPLYDRAEWQALHRLSVLTGQPLPKLDYLREAAAIPVAAASVSVGVPADLLRRRPDLRQAERKLAAATARIGAAEAELYPKLTLTGYINLQSAASEDLFAWRSRAFSFGPAIVWPIVEAGRLRAAVDVKKAQEEEALLTYQQTLQNAVEEVRDEAVTFSTEQRRHAALEDAASADQESVDLAKQLYGQGLTDFLTVLDAERQLYQAQDALVQSDTQETTSLIALYKALGGGWETMESAATAAARPASATQPGQKEHSHE